MQKASVFESPKRSTNSLLMAAAHAMIEGTEEYNHSIHGETPSRDPRKIKRSRVGSHKKMGFKSQNHNFNSSQPPYFPTNYLPSGNKEVDDACITNNKGFPNKVTESNNVLPGSPSPTKHATRILPSNNAGNILSTPKPAALFYDPDTGEMLTPVSAQLIDFRRIDMNTECKFDMKSDIDKEG